MEGDEIIEFDESFVQGKIAVPGKVEKPVGGNVEYNTLDEPIKDTFVSAYCLYDYERR